MILPDNHIYERKLECSSIPKISVIVPLYNVEKFILQCLSSVSRQTYEGSIECIVVDDCGVDNSVAIVERFISTYNGKVDFRFVHHNHNQGPSAARNTGMEICTGDYIFFLDSDDYITDDCLDLLTKPLERDDYEIIEGKYKSINEDFYPFSIMVHDISAVNRERIAQLYADRVLSVMACNRLYKTSFLKQNNITFVKGQLHEDELWTYKCVLNLHKLYISTAVTYNYVMHESSITHQKSQNLGKKCAAYGYMAEYILSNPLHCNSDTYETIVNWYVREFIMLAEDWNGNYFQHYKKCCKCYSDNPIIKDMNYHSSCPKSKTIKHLDYPPIFGYLYLKLRSFKHKHSLFRKVV